MMSQKGSVASGKHFSLIWKQMKALTSTTLLTFGSSTICFWMKSTETLSHGQILGTAISSRSEENLRKLRMTCFFSACLRMALVVSMGHVKMDKIKVNQMNWREGRTCPYMELTGTLWMTRYLWNTTISTTLFRVKTVKTLLVPHLPLYQRSSVSPLTAHSQLKVLFSLTIILHNL